MSRPTVSLACIAKNERHNFDALFSSIQGCFDEVHITDTGSTDGSIEYLTDLVKNGRDMEVLGCPLKLHFFEWIQDFGAARSFAFSHVKTDFVMWLDLDDSLSDKEAFKLWRDNAMGLADYWLATYQYAFDDNKNPVCSFARERVFRVSKEPKWYYFVHEGVKPTPGMISQYVITWCVKHRRTLEDLKKDHGRNLAIFEKNKEKLDSRMMFYYGKELFEANKPMDAFAPLMEAITRKDLEPHDRVLGIQYAALSSISCNQFERAIEIAYQGLRLEPNRAEFYAMLGDCYARLNRLKDAVPFYFAAKNCVNSAPASAKYQGAIYNHEATYGQYPTENLAKIFYAQARFDEARIQAKDGIERYNSEPCKLVLAELDKAVALTEPNKKGLVETEEIVITTGPQGAYPWDSNIYKTKGLGGSETAAIEMAKWLRLKTGRVVKIFNPRETILMDDDGVEYHPIKDVLTYFSKFKPKIHIAWRHNIKLTDATTYLWCHDLVTQGCELSHSFDKMICLSEFHKNYVRSIQGVPDDKIIVSRNGVDPSRFLGIREKNPNKVIFPSSPDRSLDRAMWIMDEARKTLPDLELHVYYGLENLEKYGLGDLAKKLKQMMSERPWVKYHGNVDQKTLAKEMTEAVAWLYPATFIESFCILAIETQLAGVYGLVREIGALQNTYRDAHLEGRGELIDSDSDTPEKQKLWADRLVNAIQTRAWDKCWLDTGRDQRFSWESVSDEWIEFMDLNEKPKEEVAVGIANLA